MTLQTHDHTGTRCGCQDPVLVALADPTAQPSHLVSDEESGSVPRPTPCATCPYRENVPSGIWAAEEYEKLPRYDRDIAAQPQAVFMCHQQEGHVCAGWLGYRDPRDLLAVRLGIITGELDPVCADYATDVPLFPSGAAAAEHGTRDLAAPGPRAQDALDKLTTIADRAGTSGSSPGHTGTMTQIDHRETRHEEAPS